MLLSKICSDLLKTFSEKHLTEPHINFRDEPALCKLHIAMPSLGFRHINPVGVFNSAIGARCPAY